MTRLVVLGSAGYHPSSDRHTACLLLPEPGIMLDAGTGFFRAGPLLAREELDIVLTHVHLDHVAGLTFLLDMMPESMTHNVTVHGRPRDVRYVRTGLFDSPLFPVPFPGQFRDIRGPVEIRGWRLSVREQVHPGGSLGVRLDGPTGSVVYITDTTADASDDEAVAFASGADLLIHECNFPDVFEDLARKTGHSTTGLVTAFARRAKPRRLVLTHLSPMLAEYSLEEMRDVVAKEFPDVALAHDLDEFDV